MGTRIYKAIYIYIYMSYITNFSNGIDDGLEGGKCTNSDEAKGRLLSDQGER